MRALKRPEGLNVIPLIDVMLVLLAIVLTVSTFISQGIIQVDLPQSSQSEKPSSKEVFEIVINDENHLHINDSIVAIEDLEAMLKPLSLDTPIVLRSDKKSDFGIFVQIMDILKAKGYDEIKIAVKES
jgi:biopolymer transport protein ExbD